MKIYRDELYLECIRIGLRLETENGEHFPWYPSMPEEFLDLARFGPDSDSDWEHFQLNEAFLLNEVTSDIGSLPSERRIALARNALQELRKRSAIERGLNLPEAVKGTLVQCPGDEQSSSLADQVRSIRMEGYFSWNDELCDPFLFSGEPTLFFACDHGSLIARRVALQIRYLLGVRKAPEVKAHEDSKLDSVHEFESGVVFRPEAVATLIYELHLERSLQEFLTERFPRTGLLNAVSPQEIDSMIHDLNTRPERPAASMRRRRRKS